MGLGLALAISVIVTGTLKEFRGGQMVEKSSFLDRANNLTSIFSSVFTVCDIMAGGTLSVGARSPLVMILI